MAEGSEAARRGTGRVRRPGEAAGARWRSPAGPGILPGLAGLAATPEGGVTTPRPRRRFFAPHRGALAGNPRPCLYSVRPAQFPHTIPDAFLPRARPPTSMADSITPRDTDYAQWYQDVIRAARLAETSPVRGSMVLPPNGYELW